IPCMLRFFDRAGSADGSRLAPLRCRLPPPLTTSAPRSLDFAAQYPGLHVPLSTLRLRPRGRQRMTRGHRGSLLLRCRALSSPSPCRFYPGALTGQVLSPAARCPRLPALGCCGRCSRLRGGGLRVLLGSLAAPRPWPSSSSDTYSS